METNKKTIINNKFNFAVHPGIILKKFLKDMKITQRNLSIKTNINKTMINELISGKRSFNVNIGIKLEPVFGVKPSFWANLQNNYDEAIIRLQNKTIKEYKIVDTKKYELKTIKVVSQVCSDIINCAV